MRRAEMARRRKNLSEKRNEEEKVPSLFNLLLCDCPHFCMFALHLRIIFSSIFISDIKVGQLYVGNIGYPNSAPSNLKSAKRPPSSLLCLHLNY